MFEGILISAAVIIILVIILRQLARSYRSADPSTSSDYTYDEIYEIIGTPMSNIGLVARAFIKLRYGQVVAMELRELKLENNTVSYQGYTVAVFESGKGFVQFNPSIMVDLGQEMRFEGEYSNFNAIQPSNSTSKEVQILK